MKEKRTQQRYMAEYQAGFATHMIFMYELLDAHMVNGIHLHREGLATLLNISKTGCYIHSLAPFPQDARLLITLTPPATPDEKIVVTGVIVRRMSGGGDDGYCGVQFSEFHDDTEEMLHQFIAKLTPG